LAIKGISLALFWIPWLISRIVGPGGGAEGVPVGKRVGVGVGVSVFTGGGGGGGGGMQLGGSQGGVVNGLSGVAAFPYAGSAWKGYTDIYTIPNRNITTPIIKMRDTGASSKSGQVGYF
jgi:hypothetical protein